MTDTSLPVVASPRRRAEPAVYTNASVATANDRIDVALSGTSNSIFLNGLAHGLGKHPRVRSFVNRSQGASGTVAIAGHVRDFDLTGFRYLFIEYCINETAMLAKGKEHIDNTFRHIAALVDHAAGFGVVPILVNFPTIHTLGQTVPMMTMLEREFVARGVAMFDVQVVLEAWGRARGIDIRACFHDPLHLERPVAAALGAIMLDTVERARTAGSIAPWVEATDATYGGIDFVSAGRLITPEATRITRSNRLMTVDLIRLATGQTVTIPPRANRTLRLRGVAYNSARTVGRLTDPVGDLVLSVSRTHLFGTVRDLSVVNVPARLSDRVIRAPETITFTPPPVAPEGEHPAVFELAGFVVHVLEDEHELRIVSMAESHRRLHQTVTDDDLRGLDAAWATVPPKPAIASRVDGRSRGGGASSRDPNAPLQGCDAAWSMVERALRNERRQMQRPLDTLARHWRAHLTPARHEAGGTVHLAVATGPDGSSRQPLMWSNRAQFLNGPIVRFGDVVVTPAPLGGYALHPFPTRPVRAVMEEPDLAVSIAFGDAAALWSQDGGPKGQAWTAQCEWGGVPVDPRLTMFAGGLFNPGVEGGRIVDPSAQARLVPAVDALIGSTPEYDRNGRATGRAAHRHSSSPAIAFMIRRALGADGHGGATRWMYATIGVEAGAIDHVLPSVAGGASGWYERVFEPTLANLVAAAGDQRPRIVDIPLEHGEADGLTTRRADYRAALDTIVATMTVSVTTATGQTRAPVFAQTQVGMPLPTAGRVVDRPPLDVSDVALAILDKGLSPSPADADYLCVGPRYDLTYVGPAHLDHFGHLHNDERRAHVLNEHERLRRADPTAKWRPAHVRSARVEARDGKWLLILTCHVPFPPLRIDVDLISRKPGFGFHPRGGDTTPSVTVCRIGEDGVSVELELSGPWTGADRIVGIATRATTDRQGWLTTDEAPSGAWRHVGLGCNVHDSAPWSSVATGRLLPNWLCSQFVPVTDGAEREPAN